MLYLFLGTIILFSVTLIFYIVFFSLIYYWHVKRISYVVVPLIFTFEFFLVAFFVVALGLIVANYFPVVLEALKEIRIVAPRFR
ncbi:MAG: hypothetical protein EXS52_01455 [Candidatus Staskawiczbacteria bacterium]|nr:hypothetical protein [Candidatus Staskawiczbacteria bacterium]